jgi:hypothetical protein
VLEVIWFQSEKRAGTHKLSATLAEGGGDEVLAGVRDLGEVLNGGLARLRHGERPGVFLLVGGGERALGRDGGGGYQEKSKG